MPSNRSIELLDTENVLRLGIKFHPGSPYRLWGLNGKQTLNGCFNQLESVHPLLDSKQLTDLLALRDKPKDIAKKLDALIRTIASEGVVPNTSNENHYSLVRKALCHLEGHGSDELEKQLSCSRRTLERAVMKVTGLTIKQHEIMKRLDLLFTYLYKHADKTLNWVDIALKFGFSDQPHLIRELKKYIGATPGSYLNTRNLIIDIYGDFESPPEMNNRYVKSKITALSLLFNIEQSDMVTMAKTKVNK